LLRVTGVYLENPDPEIDFDLSVEEEHWRALSWASAFPRGYPYDFIEYSDAAH